MGQTFQSPLKEGANVICANTHKTLPGPQKGMIAFRDKELGEKANAIINGCLYSSPHTHHMIALATTILEMKKFGEKYAKQIITNSNALGYELLGLGYQIRRANTGRVSENHQVHLLPEKPEEYKSIYSMLFANNIAVNFDNPLGGNFIRMGTQEVSRRGMKEKEMKQIATFIDKSLKGENIRSQLIEFNNTFRSIYYSFDQS
jgi:glycine hydroxymethyltransferase